MDSLKKLLCKGRDGKWKEQEQDAFLRLVVGYRNVQLPDMVSKLLTVCASSKCSGNIEICFRTPQAIIESMEHSL
jgi:hypothetical protein